MQSPDGEGSAGVRYRYFSSVGDVLKHISSLVCHVFHVVHASETMKLRCGFFSGLVKLWSEVACEIGFICGTA